MQQKFDDRRIEIDKAGSIAEASLQLNGVFQAAEEVCKQYMENIEQLNTRQEQVCEPTVREIKEKCRNQEQRTEEKCAKMIVDAKKESQSYWNKASKNTGI